VNPFAALDGPEKSSINELVIEAADGEQAIEEATRARAMRTMTKRESASRPIIPPAGFSKIVEDCR
jgi:hypothetical protein